MKQEEADVRQKIIVVRTLVESSQAKLEAGLDEQNVVLVKAANELLKMGTSQLQEAMKEEHSCRKKLTEAESRKRKATESLKSLLEEMQEPSTWT